LAGHTLHWHLPICIIGSLPPGHASAFHTLCTCKHWHDTGAIRADHTSFQMVSKCGSQTCSRSPRHCPDSKTGASAASLESGSQIREPGDEIILTISPLSRLNLGLRLQEAWGKHSPPPPASPARPCQRGRTHRTSAGKGGQRDAKGLRNRWRFSCLVQLRYILDHRRG
jgi:hypothetical protein